MRVIIEVLENVDIFDKEIIYSLYAAGIHFSENFLTRKALAVVQKLVVNKKNLPEDVDDFVSHFKLQIFQVVDNCSPEFRMRHFLHKLITLSHCQELCFFCKRKVETYSSIKFCSAKLFTYKILKQSFNFIHNILYERTQKFDARELFIRSKSVKNYIDTANAFGICIHCKNSFKFISVSSYCKFWGLKRDKVLNTILCDENRKYLASTNRGYFAPTDLLEYIRENYDFKYAIIGL